ncbi:MAG: DMT family transporter [Candidatus Zixiibacteriota bacterium]|nr:MAG: DMT family transporter [candidate division Zixibacteria bacterium]
MLLLGKVKALQPKHRNALADIGLLYVAAIWGSTFFIVKATLDDIDPVILVGYRLSLAGFLPAAYLLTVGRSLFVNLKWGVILGVITYLIFVPQCIGLKYTTASNSAFITGSFVAFVPLFMLTLFRKKPLLTEWLATAVALLGLWILTGGLVDVNNGDLLTLITAVWCAFHLLFADRFMKAGADPLIISCQQFLVAGILSLVTAAVFDLPFTIGSSAAAQTLVFLAIFPTLIGISIQMWAQRIRPPIRVSMFFALEPVFAALFAWTLGGEEFIAHRALGGLFIFVALVISGLRRPPAKGETLQQVCD